MTKVTKKITPLAPLSRAEDRCFEALKRLAGKSEGVPLVREIAEEMGISSTGRASELFTALQLKGYVRCRMELAA